MQTHPLLFAATLSAAATLSLAACGDSAGPDPRFPCAVVDRPGVIPDLSTLGAKYVVSEIRLGNDGAEAAANGFDLDGDCENDNSLGGSISLAYSFLDRDTQGTLDDALARGDMLHLLVLGEPSPYAETFDVARVFLGADTDNDPSNNFSGEATLEVRDGTRVDQALFGERGSEAVLYDHSLSSATLENTTFAPLALPLHHARLEAELLDDGVTLRGRIGGLIDADDIASSLEPTIIASMIADVEADCPGTTYPECCVADSRGADWLRYFQGGIFDDTDHDCVLEADEVRDGSLLGSILAPDIDSDGDEASDSLSVGFGFTAVPAQFDIP